MTTANQSDKDRVVIFDTTLRDGEQCPGATMTFEEKLEVAELLDTMGVDIIEAGFPIASDGDFEAVREIAKRTKNAVVCGLSRAGQKDIDRCAEAIKPAKRGRIHSFLSTSPVHKKYKLQMEPAQVLDLVVSSVTRARNHTDDVEWSSEDGTRTEFDFLCKCVESAIKAGATTINIPDTVGYSVPEEYYHLFKRVRENVPNSDKAVFSVHCHNDLGMAVANSMAGVRGGARQIECTINGIGERAGNAALEEVVMAMKVRNDKLPYWNKIDTTMLTRASKVVSAATSFPVQYNKAIVGRNAFAHESGIHQDGMLKNAQTYEIMLPETVGVKQTSLVMGKHSGRHAFIHKLEEMGYKLQSNQLEDAFVRKRTRARSDASRVDDGCGRHARPATRDDEARCRRPDQDRRRRGQRAGRCGVQLHQDAGAQRGEVGTLSGPRRHGRNRRAGGSLRSPVAGWPLSDCARFGPRYAGGVREGLSERAQ